MTTQISISFSNKSDSSATTARTQFFVFAKLHMLININFRTAKVEALFDIGACSWFAKLIFVKFWGGRLGLVIVFDRLVIRYIC